MDLYDHDPVTDDELAGMPEDQRLRATMNRQLVEEARTARDSYLKASAAYGVAWDETPPTTPDESERALDALTEVIRLLDASEKATKEAIEFVVSAASDNPPREADLGGH